MLFLPSLPSWYIYEPKRKDSFLFFLLERIHLSQEGGKVSLGMHSVCLRLEPGNIQGAVTFMKLLVS